jgi:Protein of unknown function (DUF2723)
MSFNKMNNIVGWAVCFIACLVYILTMEANASLWDCGEFISSAAKLQIPHPPGAPLFVLIGRLFAAFGETIGIGPAVGVNLMSALSSGFTILFLFWSITHFARRIVLKGTEQMSKQQMFTIMSAGVVGALAYTFSDSFWYSAVEGEVYAMSSFFTAVVFWAMLKWEHNADQPGSDRWIILIFFLMGLSIGVHLLNLLTIPAIVMIYYYKRYKPTVMGSVVAFFIGVVITGLVQKVVIQYSIKGAGAFDVYFVNDFGLPFFSGFITFFVLIAALIFVGLRVARKRNWSYLRLGLWCFAFMLLGYSTYFTTLIRSGANPAVDMYNVDNPMSLEGYLGREQYGDWPLLKGPHFTAQPSGYDLKETYQKSKDKYIKIPNGIEYKYNDEDMVFFPRVWDSSPDQDHPRFYAEWLNLQAYQDPKTGEMNYETPTYADNIKWFWTYQMNWMYFRYFMWNFAGKQNDLQGFGNPRDGNWISGISFIDNARLGDQSKLPDSLKNNKANNKLFFLPLFLGIIGLIFQFLRDKRGWIVTGLLFFFTGIAIVLYLNQAGGQPRERDYAYVGSFYAFAFWIGLGVIQVKEWFDKLKLGNASNIAATLLCLLAVPVLMASQEWDDHDRSKKLLARDLAKDYLESCAPNAILITFGDNDTYPLWYAQEVEGIRPDVRVINQSLMGIDWYLNQLRYKINKSDGMDVIFTPEQIEGRTRDVVYVAPDKNIPQDRYFDLYTILKDFVGSEEPSKKNSFGRDQLYNYFPITKFTIPVDQNLVRSNGTVTPTDSILSELRIDLPAGKNAVVKNELAILSIIAANKWKRPIYFTSPYGDLGFGPYLRKDGLSYRLVPVACKPLFNNWIVDQMMRANRMGGTPIRDNNTDTMYNNLMTKFAFGNANVAGVYFDEENRRHLLGIRSAFAEAAGNMADINRKDEAKRLLARCDSMMNQSNFPYAMASRYNMYNSTSLIYAEAAYKAGMNDMGDKIINIVQKDLDQQEKYYKYLRENREELYNIMSPEPGVNDIYKNVILEIQKKYKGGGIQPGAETPGTLKNTPGQPATPPTAVPTAVPAPVKTDTPGKKPNK